ncbi:OLC1v1009158C1 [Oldenlandia corymbosa var. corymbosa]|uniref:OLC1v1009158C1 n=1 Tax=Oldenlandia corymbosa var. corymbosa TaxID=529605 RepID=A0AAV1DPS7_OLDCO|nr:OLC1v1009158C1 [Oldenlandia corymbosa var. corymbosa]
MADRNNEGDTGEQRERRTFEDDGRFQRNPDDDRSMITVSLGTHAQQGTVSTQNSAMFVQKGKPRKEEKNGLWCDLCKKSNHNQENCFRIHGYPDWWRVPGSNKGPKKFGGTKNMTHMENNPIEIISLNNSNNVGYNGSGSVIVPSTASMGYNGYGGSSAKMIPPQHQGIENLQAIVSSLNCLQQEMSRIAKGKGVQTDSSGQLVNFAHYTDFAGMNYDLILGTVDMIKPGSWFMDSGATGLMTNDLELLNSYNPVSHPTPISLPPSTSTFGFLYHDSPHTNYSSPTESLFQLDMFDHDPTDHSNESQDSTAHPTQDELSHLNSPSHNPSTSTVFYPVSSSSLPILHCNHQRRAGGVFDGLPARNTASSNGLPVLKLLLSLMVSWAKLDRFAAPGFLCPERFGFVNAFGTEVVLDAVVSLVAPAILKEFVDGDPETGKDASYKLVTPFQEDDLVLLAGAKLDRFATPGFLCPKGFGFVNTFGTEVVIDAVVSLVAPAILKEFVDGDPETGKDASYKLVTPFQEDVFCISRQKLPH